MKFIILNNSSRESTVLKAFLNISDKRYKDISVIFPKNIKEENSYKAYNVRICSPSIFDWVKGILFVIFQILSKYTYQDFILAKKQKKFNILYFTKYIKSILIAYIEFLVTEKLLKKICIKTYVFSMWYAENAIATAMIKRKYPNIVAASYAHSYEVDPIKNKYVGIIRDRFKEEYIDKIYFISETVMNNYLKYNSNILTNYEKYIPLHFGSIKKYDKINKSSSDGYFRIVTCSGISKVKRLEVLAEALRIGQFHKPIIWSILGDGPLKEKIRIIISKYDRKKIKAIMYGLVSNDDVHKFYAENPVDLFINISISEGLPVSIMEAMSYGIPVLATDVGGNREIVNEKTGLLINSEITVEQIANEINNLMSENLTIKRNNAYIMWEKNYQIENNVLSLLTDIEQIKVN